jgi:uncharacterized protein
VRSDPGEEAAGEEAMGESFGWIPMSDGVRLAATIYLPVDTTPQPAVLEALPYRKDDVTAYDTPEYRRLCAEGGYAVCRVDLRGTGTSEGIALDEYPEQEQRDLREVIAWLAAQSWCDGSVGMYGTSYSGFNSLQVAAERPPALKAICAVFATDDRYTDDVHYGGGIRRALDLVDYPLYMVALNALPPVPELAGPQWRDEWRRRVEKLDPWLLRWLGEQVDGPYWRHGSLRPDYERIECATMIVGGWADGYRNATLRVFERLGCPKRLLIGPWAHTSTETSRPGPRIDLVPEMIRWWDRWLRGRSTSGEEPPIIVFARRSTAPAGDLDEMRGEFRFEPAWPLERGSRQRWELSDGVAPGPGHQAHPRPRELAVRGDVGACASIWCAGALPFGLPLDQRPDEALSLSYEWEPLADELEILGYPTAELRVTSSAPVAFVSVKLCDVFPDGRSALVCRGVLNLTHRASHSRPEPLEPDKPYDVVVELDATSWIFEAGHRLRLDVAGADWPNVWPPPEPLTLGVSSARSALVLPVVEGPSPVVARPRLAPPRARPARAPHDVVGDGAPVVWRIEDDVVRGEKRVVIDHGAEAELEIGGRLSEHYFGVVGVSTADPGSAYARGRSTFELAWPGVTAAAEARLSLTSDALAFHVALALDVDENGARKWSRRWERTYPRRLA